MIHSVRIVNRGAAQARLTERDLHAAALQVGPVQKRGGVSGGDAQGGDVVQVGGRGDGDSVLYPG